jgi:hypothetical protein
MSSTVDRHVFNDSAHSRGVVEEMSGGCPVHIALRWTRSLCVRRAGRSNPGRAPRDVTKGTASLLRRRAAKGLSQGRRAAPSPLPRQRSIISTKCRTKCGTLVGPLAPHLAPHLEPTCWRPTPTKLLVHAQHIGRRLRHLPPALRGL